MKQSVYFILILLAFSCKNRQSPRTDNVERSCYPDSAISKVRILVGDTAILDHYFPDDTTGTVNVMYGVGFVTPEGQPVHKPLQSIWLSDKQKADFLHIFRPIEDDPDVEDFTTSCVPVYRHVAQFYNKADSLTNQVYICLECFKIDFWPRDTCLPSFASRRSKEVKDFFRDNGIYITEQ